MKIYKKSAIFVLSLAFLILASSASAAAPILTLSSASDGDSVTLTITGDASANVVFYYSKTGSNLQMNYLGKTDTSGNFFASLSTAAYGITAESFVYVTVNGQKSNERAWPYLAAAKVLSISQTSVVLPLGNSVELTAYNNGTNFIYLSSNSNPPVVNVNIDGNKITLKAFYFGSTQVNVCAGVGTPSCASVYVTVQNTGGQALAFSQNNPTVAAGQNVVITVIGGTGTYTLLNNSNANTIQASLSGNAVTLSTTNTSGSSAITVCSSDISSCGIINAVIGNVSSSGLTFSITNPTMNIGQNLSITISGGAGGNYSIFSNSNTNAVSANISGSALVLTANNGGSATITVCSSMGNCAPEVVSVNYNTTSGGSISLSQNNLWLLVGQSASITVSGGQTPYSISGYSENILSGSFNNNILNITGVGSGSASVNVCSAAGGCKILSVLISGTSASAETSTNTATTAVTPLSLSQTSLALSVGNTGKVLITGNGGYNISTNPNSSVATVVISGSTATVTAVGAGSTNFSFCQSGGQCATVAVTVSASQVASESASNAPADWVLCAQEKQTCQFSGYQTVRYGANGKYYYGSYLNGATCANSVFGDPIVNVVKQCYYGGTIPEEVSGAVAAVTETAKYKFTKILVYGASGDAVKELQKRFKADGFYSGVIDGKFLTSTVVAVKKYQKAKGIKQTGNLGVLTMAALNK